MEVQLPYKWQPRPYQLKLWNYLESGGKRAVACWHRRAGKDENCLHWAAVAAHQRVATYWHMLPEASQARKAIWDAINPHTGIRRIDEAFPLELRETTRENEMLIKFKNGSTWQVVGSDNFNSLIGSPPAGVVFSEWSLANPSSWAYLRPILRENGGWAMFIYTARGRNHGLTILDEARHNPEWFGELLTAENTGVFTTDELKEELNGYIREYGEDEGRALFNQEYYCSFTAATLGSVYGTWIERAENNGRVGFVPIDRKVPVQTGWDLGYSDATAIWFFQVFRNEVRFVDYHESSGKDPEFYCDLLKTKASDPNRPFKYGGHWVPADAAHKLLAAKGRSFVQQCYDFGVKMQVVPETTHHNGMTAGRKLLDIAWFDEEKCKFGLDALRSYHRKWDDKKKILSDNPVHDWSSHGSKALELIGRVWQTPADNYDITPERPRFLGEQTFDEVFWKGLRQ